MSNFVSRKRLVIPLVCALSCAAPAAAANLASPSVAIYYSFDLPPSLAAVGAMKAETAKIFDPALISIDWRALGPHGGESAGELIVVRFRGSCSDGIWSAENHASAVTGGFPLADSKTVNGQVLPFADIDCGALETYLSGQHFAQPAESLGKAMARVLSHEIYHILTDSPAHARTGIARAEHSRDDLTASAFTFGKPEMDWLKDWSARSRLMASGGYSTASAGISDEGSTAESDAGAR